jgi:hypothetical protein
MAEDAQAISESELRSVVRAAIRAPSSHNTQPWLFELAGDTISLYADRLRALPANDPFDRELTVSCGSALFNLRAAIAALGMATRIELLPEGPRSDLLATVRLQSGEGAGEAELAANIEDRRTTRGEFTGVAPDPDLIARMKSAAAAEGAWLEVVSESSRRETLSDLIAEGDRRQFSDPTWRRELASWLHPRRAGDGLAMPGFSRPIAKLVVSAFDLGKTAGKKDARLAVDAPCMAVLGTEFDLDENWLEAGQALQRALLIAASQGVQAGYLNQPCQVSDLRPRLRGLLDHRGYPQVVMRLGHPDSNVEPSPRRDPDQVLQKALRVTSRFG